MSDTHRSSGVIKWWAMIVVGTAAALLIAWLSDVAGVSLRTVLSIAAGAAALAWLVVLVAVPWNLYFAARGHGDDGLARARHRSPAGAGGRGRADRSADAMVRARRPPHDRRCYRRRQLLLRGNKLVLLDGVLSAFCGPKDPSPDYRS